MFSGLLDSLLVALFQWFSALPDLGSLLAGLGLSAFGL